jgi:two-component system, LytTR family, response regulator
MIKTIIVDDEKNNIGVLRSMLTSFPDISIIADAGDAEEAYTIIKQLKPQLVFLDIEMPFGNAFDLLERLMPVDFEIIFVTAFDQYAIKAFRYGAMDYLLKPIIENDLRLTVTRAVERMNSKDVNIRLKKLLEQLHNEEVNTKKIALPTAQGVLFRDIDSIVRLEAESSYTRIFLNDGSKEIVTRNLKEFEESLPASSFCRIHNSHIVNLRYIKKYNKGRGGSLELTDGTILEVSSRKKDEFLRKFGL